MFGGGKFKLLRAAEGDAPEAFSGYAAGAQYRNDGASCSFAAPTRIITSHFFRLPLTLLFTRIVAFRRYSWLGMTQEYPDPRRDPALLRKGSGRATLV